MGRKRQLARRLPVLSRLVRSLERVEAENDRLRARIDQLESLHLREAGAPVVNAEVAEDGLPLPPAALRQWVTGGPGAEGFVMLGRAGADVIVDVLRRNGLAFERVGRVLDFGCGSGRVIRHFARVDSVHLHGSDYNRAAVTWCDEHLPFAEFGTNALLPPTRYRSGSFDLIYAFSVFTHLDEPLQRPWMDELRRILAPAGHLIISTHGERCLASLSAGDRARFGRGELVVVAAAAPGRNDCGAFHPQSFLRRELAVGFEVREFTAGGASGNPPQDLWLLHRA